LLIERIDQDREYEVPFIPYVHRTRYLVAASVSLSGYETKCYILGNTVGFVPVPDSNVTDAIRVTYVPPPTALVSATSPPTEWTTDHHEVIVLAALLRVGIRDRENRKLRVDQYNELKLELLEATAIRQSQEPKAFEQVEEQSIEWG